MQMIKLAEEAGPVLAGRVTAVALRQRIEGLVLEGDDVIIDLQGVQAISPSFADELFGKLPVAARERITFQGASGFLSDVARMARTNRGHAE